MTTEIVVTAKEKETFAVSYNFPRGYGDLALLSEDKVISYFPSQLLIYVSKHFKKILPELQAKAKPEEGELMVKIAALSIALEAFLKHIDPAKLTPPLTILNAEGLVSLALQLGVVTVLQWFQREAIITQGDTVTGITNPAFVATHPCLALDLALRIKSKSVANAALRELAGCDERVISLNARSLTVPALLEIQNLRSIRIKRYEGWIEVLASPKSLITSPFFTFNSSTLLKPLPSQSGPLSSSPKPEGEEGEGRSGTVPKEQEVFKFNIPEEESFKPASKDVISTRKIAPFASRKALLSASSTSTPTTSSTQPASTISLATTLIENLRSSVTTEDESKMKVCMFCTSLRARWVLAIATKIRNSPKWASFADAYDGNYKCIRCAVSWPDYFRSQLADWKVTALQEESRMPEWSL